MAQDPEFETRFYESVLRRHPRDVRVLRQLGHLYTAQGRIEEGLQADRKLVRLQPKDPLAHYNLACSLSLKRQKPQALRSLRRAFELGYDDADYLSEDPDLACLHGMKGFERLVAEMRMRSSYMPKNGYFLS